MPGQNKILSQVEAADLNQAENRVIDQDTSHFPGLLDNAINQIREDSITADPGLELEEEDFPKPPTSVSKWTPRLTDTKHLAEQAALLDVGEMDATDILLVQAQMYQLLEPGEETELAKAIEKGDLAAKELMINSNLRLVVAMSKHYQGQGLDKEDLVQEGMIGLIRGVEKFDWRRGYKFSTYGVLWIKQAFQRSLQNKGKAIRMPVSIEAKLRKAYKVQVSFVAQKGRDPNNDELAYLLDEDVEEIDLIFAIAKPITSLEKEIGEGEDGSYQEFIASPSDTVEEVQEVIEEHSTDRMTRLLGKNGIEKPDQVKEMLMLHYHDEIPIRTIAMKHNLTAKEVQEILDKAANVLMDHKTEVIRLMAA
jgi:RNA polymerase primary sigma factor